MSTDKPIIDTNRDSKISSVSPYTSRSKFNFKPNLTARAGNTHRSTTPVNTTLLKPKKTKFDSKKHNYNSFMIDSVGIITPEIAAQVVKNYLLPMFEGDEKSRSKSTSNLTKLMPNSDLLLSTSSQPNTIYGELKLSTLLLDRIKTLESEYASLKAELDSVTSEKEACILHMK